MNIATKHFERTIAIGQTIGINFEKAINTQTSSNKKVSKEVKNCIKFYKGPHLKKIKEIYAIEKEKLKLRDSIKIVRNIFEKEALYNIEREILLKLPPGERSQITLKINSLISIYEADWKWSEREPFEKIFNLKKILITKKADHYFLLERTGTFDFISDSNVCEFPLTEYQYYILQVFEKSKKVKDVLSDLAQLLDVTDEIERIEFFILTEKVIKYLVFKRFIVAGND